MEFSSLPISDIYPYVKPMPSIVVNFIKHDNDAGQVISIRTDKLVDLLKDLSTAKGREKLTEFLSKNTNGVDHLVLEIKNLVPSHLNSSPHSVSITEKMRVMPVYYTLPLEETLNRMILEYGVQMNNHLNRVRVHVKSLKEKMYKFSQALSKTTLDKIPPVIEEKADNIDSDVVDLLFPHLGDAFVTTVKFVLEKPMKVPVEMHSVMWHSSHENMINNPEALMNEFEFASKTENVLYLYVRKDAHNNQPAYEKRIYEFHAQSDKTSDWKKAVPESLLESVRAYQDWLFKLYTADLASQIDVLDYIQFARSSDRKALIECLNAQI